jgi:predicted Zn finger-like uncharacterized protein
VQTNCPHCSQGLTIDDSRIPDRAYSIKCPHCQNAVRFLGKGTPPLSANGSAAPAPANGNTLPVSAGPPTATAASEEMRAQIMAKVRQEIATGEPAGAGQAIVALADRGQADAITRTLTRLGFAVDAGSDSDGATRSIEQGTCTLLATAKTVNGIGVPPSLYQRLNRLSSTTRRGVFVVLVGDELKSGDANQAFSSSADLVLHPRELATFDNLLRSTIAERNRLYQAFLDARLRFEASGSARALT